MISIADTAPCAVHRADGLGLPDAMLQVLRAAATRDIDISFGRESADGVPIGWLLNMYPNTADRLGATMNAQPEPRGSMETSADPTAYLNTTPTTITPATLGDVYDLIAETTPAPYDLIVPNGYILADVLSAAVQNGWSIHVDHRAESRATNEKFGMPNMLTVECSAFDYENAFTDHRRGSIEYSLTLHEADDRGARIPPIVGLIDGHGFSKSTPEAFFDAVIHPAPYTVLTAQYDDDM